MISTPLNSPRLSRLIVVAWLALLSIALVMLALSLSSLDAQRLQDAPDAQIAELSNYLRVAYGGQAGDVNSEIVKQLRQK